MYRLGMAELVLHQMPGRPWGTPNLSPFCAKLETYLRIAAVPHTTAPADMRVAPKGKVPYVRFDDRTLMGDSQLVIERLEAAAGDQALDAGLSAHDRAIGHAVRRMLEEGFYFVAVYLRWHEDEGYEVLTPEFKKMLPAPLRMIMPLIRRSVRKTLHKQGTSRHGREDVVAMGIADLAALAELLGDRPFLLGDQPRTVDATVFAFLEGVLGFPRDTEVQARARSHLNLVAYRQRVRERWYKDLAAA
jgi:glutathione S-transferase